MELSFITSSESKFRELQALLPELVQLKLDLPEIQEIDPKAIISAKLQEAFMHASGNFVVEDTSLSLDCLGGSLPGPLIKWFSQVIHNEGLAELAFLYDTQAATARTWIGYADSPDNIHFFEGAVRGQIVRPRGESNFGWDPIFQPDGEEKTFAEMTSQEKARYSMRIIAGEKLRQHLTK